ncbi:MAG: DUF1667 domain-containing protein [Clostridia bacterium]|nr:DUF1667 domain-containing protein [Clostridia bacterium]
MTEKKVICTVCPKGCRITVILDGGVINSIEGNICARGKKYASDEATEPRRVLTTTVRAGEMMLSVRSTAALKKDKMFDFMKTINSTKVSTPVSIGDVIIKDIDGEGTDIVATKNLK